MVNKLPRFQKATLVLGAATGMLLCLPFSTRAQSSTPQDQQQDRQAAQSDDTMRRDVARFDQFLDSHREISDQLRKTPSLVNDQQFLQSHPELNTYLQDHPSVRQEISQHPDSFMTMEGRYDHDKDVRDGDAGGQDRDADRKGDADRGNDHDADNKGATNHDADRKDDANRDSVRGEEANLDKFLDRHREIAEQVRKDPTLLNNKSFVQNHPTLQAYLQQSPGVSERISQDPKGFVFHAEASDPGSTARNHDPMHDHMADFGGFLRSHSEIQKDLSRNPAIVKDNKYVQNHTELFAYLDAHPDVRAELMADPQGFVHGAVQAGASPSGAGNGRGTGTTTGSGTGATASTTGTSTSPATTTHEPSKPNQ